MKRPDQQTGEIREMQIPEVLEKHEETNDTSQHYRAPQVFLVGKAQHLITGLSGGKYGDGDQAWSYFE